MGIEEFEVLLNQAELEVKTEVENILAKNGSKDVLRSIFTKFLEPCTNGFEEVTISERMVEAGKEVFVPCC